MKQYFSLGSGSRLAALLVLTTLGVCGCSSSTATVTGNVRYRGQVLPSGVVVFVNADGRTSPPATIQPDGSYTAANVPVGAAKIAIDNPPPPPPEPSSTASNSPPASRVPYLPLPLQYKDANQSGKTCDVKSGHNTCDIDLN